MLQTACCCSDVHLPRSLAVLSAPGSRLPDPSLMALPFSPTSSLIRLGGMDHHASFWPPDALLLPRVAASSDPDVLHSRQWVSQLSLLRLRCTCQSRLQCLCVMSGCSCKRKSCMSSLQLEMPDMRAVNRLHGRSGIAALHRHQGWRSSQVTANCRKSDAPARSGRVGVGGDRECLHAHQCLHRLVQGELVILHNELAVVPTS